MVKNTKTPGWLWILITLVIAIGFLTLFFKMTGCIDQGIPTCKSDTDCEDNKICIDDNSIYHTKRCFEIFGYEKEDKSVLEEEVEEEFVCIENYDNLNYTTLNITREDFENLPCFRQTDWLYGVCYPSVCNKPNLELGIVFEL